MSGKGWFACKESLLFYTKGINMGSLSHLYPKNEFLFCNGFYSLDFVPVTVVCLSFVSSSKAYII